MADKKEELGQTSYLLGILSIVFGIFSPIAGLILGIVGLTISKKQKDNLGRKAMKLNKIGIVVSIIFIILSIVLTWASFNYNLYNPGFPVA